MLRAMDSAVAGLRAHQNKMDVVGHNIANVNTFGFKAQTYTFKEAMYQTSTASTAGASGTNGSAGTNAAQYGYGTLMGSIGVDMTSSTPSYVGGFNATIDGEGFFITSPEKKAGFDAGADIKGENFNYTRVGQFMVDSNGYIVDANKNFVYGYRSELKKGEVTGTSDKLTTLRLPSLKDTTSGELVLEEGDGKDPVISIAIEVNAFGKITATVQIEHDVTTGTGAGQTTEKVKSSKTIEIGQLAIATFQNPNGLTKAGGNYYVTNKNDNAGQVAAGKPGEGGSASLMTGYIESSNVDLAKEFADMITTHRGFQANSKMITVSDEILQELVNMKR